MAKKINRKRFYKRKGCWSANIKTLPAQSINLAANSSFAAPTDLCTNPAQADSTVSQQYTVKNIELNYEIDAVAPNVIEGLVSYIMYVPQGMTVTETYPNNHPEYIMAYRYLGTPNYDNDSLTATTSVGRLPCKVKTRLSRRLQTGDRIILLIVGLNQADSSQIIRFNGLKLQ